MLVSVCTVSKNGLVLMVFFEYLFLVPTFEDGFLFCLDRCSRDQGQCPPSAYMHL